MATALHWMPRGARNCLLFSGKPAVLLRAIHTSVWWDFTTCEVPKGGDPVSVVGSITEALAKLSYDAPATFSVYGDWERGSSSRDDYKPLRKRGVRIECGHFIRLWRGGSLLASSPDFEAVSPNLNMRSLDLLGVANNSFID